MWVGCARASRWYFHGGQAHCLSQQGYQDQGLAQRRRESYKYLRSEARWLGLQGSHGQIHRFMYQQWLMDWNSRLLPLHTSLGRKRLRASIGLHQQISGCHQQLKWSIFLFWFSISRLRCPWWWDSILLQVFRQMRSFLCPSFQNDMNPCLLNTFYLLQWHIFFLLRTFSKWP